MYAILATAAGVLLILDARVFARQGQESLGGVQPKYCGMLGLKGNW